jgi:hypothetical protein
MSHRRENLKSYIVLEIMTLDAAHEHSDPERYTSPPEPFIFNNISVV